MKSKLSFPLALVVAAALSAQPVLAQHGNGHGRGNGGGNGRGHEAKEQHQRVRRDDDRDDRQVRRSDDRDDGRWTDRVLRDRRTSDRYRRSDGYRNNSGTLRRRVPPGWCIGRGNPHNTVANCGAGNNRYDRRYDPRYNGGYTYDNYGRRTDRYGRTVDSYGRTVDRNGRVINDGRYGGVYGGSNRDAFNAWKRQHDANCRNLARQRPLDLRWQAQVRSQCSAEERDARRYYGV